MNDPTTPGPSGPDPQEVTVNDSTSREPEPTAPGTDLPREMPSAEADPLLARLRAADPAASSAPDLAALRGAVRARLATAGAPGATSAAQETEEDVEVVDRHGRPAPVDELAERRQRRAGWPLRVAAVAAGALVVGGGGGYAIGAAGGSADTPSEPAIAVANPFPGAPGDTAASTDAAMPESARTAAGGADAASSWGGFFGRTVFTSSGLPTEAGTARAWAFDPSSAFDAETAAAAAAALGVPGEPRQEDMFWTVGAADGTSATVQLFSDGTVSLSYYDPAKDPWFCAAPDVAEGGAAGGGVSGSEEGLVEPLPVEPCEERDLGPAPQGDAAVTALRDVLAQVGEDPAAYELEAQDPGDDRWSYVVAHQVLDGQRTGLTWGASFTGAGLQSLHGALADLVDLGEYAVVSAEEAVERLGDPRFGAGGGPVAFREGAAGMDVAVPAPSGLPTPPAAGSAVPWPVAEVTITSARLGTALHVQGDGAALLLPTYELTGDDGSVWSVLALAEEHLDLTAGR